MTEVDKRALARDLALAAWAAKPTICRIVRRHPLLALAGAFAAGTVIVPVMGELLASAALRPPADDP